MKLAKLLLLLAITAIPYSTFAAQPVKIDDLSKTTVYLNTDSIRRNGDEVSFFLIFNLKEDSKMNGETLKSFAQFIYGSCKTNTGSQAASVAFKGSLATGKMIFVNPGQESNDFTVPQKYVDKYLTEVCISK